MGLLNNLYALTPTDIRGGHRRVYDKDTIELEVHSAGFKIEEVSGILVKPFCDFQMDELIDSKFLEKQHLEGLLKLGKDYPDICGDIFAVGRK